MKTRAELEQQIREQERTIEALVAAVESASSQCSSIELWGKMVELDQVVEEKTRCLEEALRVNEELLAAQEQANRTIREEQELLDGVLNAIPFYVFWKDADGRYAGCNEAFAQFVGLPDPAAIRGRSDLDIPGIESSATLYRQEDAAVLSTGEPLLRVAEQRRLSDGTTIEIDRSKVPLFDESGRPTGVLGVLADVTEVKALQAQIAEGNRLESIGQLAAGVAHEINTPVQFVSDNTCFLDESFQDVLPLLERAADLARRVLADESAADAARTLLEALDEGDVEYLVEEIPSALDQSREGLARVARIVRAMKEFSHPGESSKTDVDVNRALESTVTVATNEWKYVAEVELDLDEHLPTAYALPSELNQVFLNVLVNAAHAIAAANGETPTEKGTIRIATRHDEDHVEVRISDTGTGIPEAARAKIFDPFFTTKEVGQGTGQGLSLAHAVVVQEHGGTLTFETELGVGTTFVIRLPLASADAEDPPAQAA